MAKKAFVLIQYSTGNPAIPLATRDTLTQAKKASETYPQEVWERAPALEIDEVTGAWVAEAFQNPYKHLVIYRMRLEPAHVHDARRAHKDKRKKRLQEVPPALVLGLEAGPQAEG